MHNHDGTFYDRYVVYKNLGFDTFTPMEYMYDVEHTQKNWEKDNVLTGEIMKTLKSTEDKDFIFTVSVQGHGRYPSELDYENYSYPVKVTGTEVKNWIMNGHIIAISFMRWMNLSRI